MKNITKEAVRNQMVDHIASFKPGDEVRFYCEDPQRVFEMFFDKYKRIIASGGIVERNNELLFIKRHGLWDLPKGKVEKGEQIEEAAVREVEEECGISGVELVKPLKITLHTYEMKGKLYLKTTHWFAMKYGGHQKLKPQREEGITDVEWIQENKLESVLAHTYPSIMEVVDAYLMR